MPKTKEKEIANPSQGPTPRELLSTILSLPLVELANQLRENSEFKILMTPMC